MRIGEMNMRIDAKHYSGYEAYQTRSKPIPAMTILVAAAILVVVINAVVYGYVNFVPPGTGYVEGKVTHPAFYPSYLCDETKYVIEITSFDKKKAWSWYVSESVYDSYEVGDYIGTLQRGSIYDEEVSGQ